ncbi:hypothetical protein Tco_0081534 [Tanacetum coccineum]
MGPESIVGLIEAGMVTCMILCVIFHYCRPRKANRSRVIHDIETGRTSQPQAPETTRVINNAVTESRHVKPDAAEGVLPNGDLTKTMEN